LRQKHLYLFTRFHRACKNRALLQRRHAGKNLKRFFSQNEIYHLNHYKRSLQIFISIAAPKQAPVFAGQVQAGKKLKMSLTKNSQSKFNSL
jgi:hypothetical protein